jgi:hypothetical protein
MIGRATEAATSNGSHWPSVEGIDSRGLQPGKLLPEKAVFVLEHPERVCLFVKIVHTFPPIAKAAGYCGPSYVAAITILVTFLAFGTTSLGRCCCFASKVTALVGSEPLASGW